MIEFNVLFVIAVLIAVLGVRSIIAYLYTINYAMTIANHPPVTVALRDNTHNAQSLSQAIREVTRYGGFWLAMSQLSVASLVVVWIVGFINGGILTDSNVLVATIALSVPLARALTAPINSAWLRVWLIGLHTIAIVCRRERLTSRINEIMAYDDVNEHPIAYAELQLLVAELKQIDEAIQITPELMQSAPLE